MLARWQRLSPDRRLIAVLFATSATLAAASLAVPNVVPLPVLSAPDSPVRMFFDVAGEANLWTWFNVLLLGAGSVLFVAVGALTRRRGGPSTAWFGSAVLLAALSLDDLASLHERLEGIGRAAGGGGLAFAWVLPGAVLGLVVLAAMAVLARHLRGAARWRLVVGVAVLLGSALGLETVTGLVLDAGDGTTRGYVVLVHVEELLEAVGAVLILAAPLPMLSWRRATDGALAVRYEG